MITTVRIVDINQAKQWLGGLLSPERMDHSVGAHDKAVELAEKFGFSAEDCERAAVAGLLHDAAKHMPPEALFAYCDSHALPVDAVDRQTPQTLHPFVGAEMVREEFGVEDEDILNAIRFHTTGRAGMSAVEKVVFIADKIEGNTRNPLYIQKMTSQLNTKDPLSLDVTMLYILDSTIEFILEKQQVLHPRTVEARNYFVNVLKSRCVS